MFETLRITLALIGGVICGIYDLKTSNMLDFVAWILIGTGIALNVFEFLLTGNTFLLFWSFLVIGFFTFFSLFMYRRGYWGGGDGEMLVAYGALLPYTTAKLCNLCFPLFLFMNIFLIGGIYSLVYGFVKVVKDKKMWKKAKREFVGLKKYIFFSLVIFLVTFLTLFYFEQTLPVKLSLHPLAFMLLLLLFYKPAIQFARFVEKNCFLRRISTKKLKEDDVLGEDIPELGLKAREIRGLTKEEVEKIKAVRKYVTIKDGVRFIPVFPLALILTLFGFPMLV